MRGRTVGRSAALRAVFFVGSRPHCFAGRDARPTIGLMAGLATLERSAFQEEGETMAYYEYECADCQHKFTVKQSFDEHDRHVEVKCPECESKQVHQLLSTVHPHTSRKS